MHALKNWMYCDDLNCPCNEHLAKKPPIVPFRNVGGKVPSGRRSESIHTTRDRARERTARWRATNPQRAAELSAQYVAKRQAKRLSEKGGAGENSEV